MRKLIIAASILSLAISCKGTPDPEAAAKYNQAKDALSYELQEAYDKVMEDQTLSDEQKSEVFEKSYEEINGRLIDLATKTIRSNRDNKLAIEALQDVYYEMEPKALEKLINCLSEDNQGDPFVARIRKSLDAKQRTAEGKMFVDFTVRQPDGTDVSLSDYVGRGKYVLVDFWASWCGPCKEEIPNVRSVREEFAGSEFEVLSVAVWDKSEATVKAAEALGIDWPQIIDAQQVPTDIYGIDGIPHIILFGPDGTILKRDLRGGNIRKEVKKALGR